MSSDGKCMCATFSASRLANSNLMQAYIKSQIRFSLTSTKLLTFLNWCWSICGLTILSLDVPGYLLLPVYDMEHVTNFTAFSG